MKVSSRALLAIGAVALLVGIGWAAGRATLNPPSDDTRTPSASTYTVEQGRVGRVLQFTASTSYERRLLAYSGSQGVITAVGVRPGQTVAAGARLFAVDEQPVLVATGTIPAFRDMAYGTQGRDVAQLQRFLTTQGYLPSTGTASNVDGDFDVTTRAAVEKWQKAVGAAEDGVVGRGDLVFVPNLPARVQLGDDIEVGRQISAGVETVFGLSEAPQFEVVLGEDQRDLVPLEGAVVLRASGQRWHGTIVRATERGGDLILTLGTRDGRPLCRSSCDRVPAGENTSYPVNIVAVPATRGPVVPVAALQTDEAGHVFVTDRSGDRTPVSVLATDGGWSVVDGVADGDVLNLTASADAGEQS